MLSSLRALCAVVLLSAPASAAVKDPDTLVYLDITESTSFDPAHFTGPFDASVLLNVYESLVARAPGGGIEPRLAREVPSRANGLLSADGLTWKFPLRRGVRFHDGSEMTGEDVKYSLMRFMLTDAAAGQSAYLLQPFLGRDSTRDASGRPVSALYRLLDEAIRATRDDVTLRLPRPDPRLPALLARFGLVLSRRWCAAQGQWDGREETWTRWNDAKSQDALPLDKANGTGPFRLERWDKTSGSRYLLRHDGYWRGPARLKRVVIRHVPEFATRKLMLQAGDADIIYAQQSDRSLLQGLPGVSLSGPLKRPVLDPIIMFTVPVSTAGNPNIGPGRLDGEGIPPDFFADPDARKMVAYAVDYEGFARDVIGDAGLKTSGIIPDGILDDPKRSTALVFALEKSRGHLRKAWGGRAWENGLRFTIVVNSGNPARRILAVMLKRNLERLSPKVRIDLLDLSGPSFSAQHAGRKMPLWINSWMGYYPDAHDYVDRMMHGRWATARNPRISDASADLLIDEASRSEDPVRRRELYRKLQTVFDGFLPYVPVAQMPGLRAQRDWVKGWTHEPGYPWAPWGSDFYRLWKE